MSQPIEDGRGQTGGDGPIPGSVSVIDVFGPEIGPMVSGGVKIIRHESRDTGIPTQRLERATLDDIGTLTIPDEFGGHTRLAAVGIGPENSATLIPITRESGIPAIVNVQLPEEHHVGFFMGYNPVQEENPAVIRTGTLRVLGSSTSIPLTFQLQDKTMTEIPYRLTGGTMNEEEQAFADQTGIFTHGFPRGRTRGLTAVVAVTPEGKKSSRIHQSPGHVFQLISLLTRAESGKPPVNLSIQAGLYVGIK